MPIKSKSNKKNAGLKRFGKIVGGTALGLFIYTSSLFGLEIYATLKGMPIKNSSQLEEIAKKEMKKLGIGDKKIKFVYGRDKSCTSYSRKIGENEYEIVIYPYLILGHNNSTSTLKHELYHIADGHFDFADKFSKDSRLDKLIFYIGYLFYYEPQAAMYEAFGWKL